MIQSNRDPTETALAAASVDAGYNLDFDRNAPLQLEDIDLDLAPGELAAVIGPNGSGKSTLVRVLSRTLPPKRGAVLLSSSDLYRSVSARESARSIGVVPQTSDFFLDFSIRDIVSMGRAPLRGKQGILGSDTLEDEQAVTAALERMGIPDELASRPISQVSGGERQRALIARALAQEAEILLLDEPTSSLDLYNQAHLLEWLRRLALEDKKAVLVVLHDLNLAAQYADRIVVLSEGRVVANGPTAEVLTAEMIRSVYNVDTWIRKNPLTGRPIALSTASSVEKQVGSSSLAGRRIHLFCGAGTGASLMFQLHAAGAIVTACVLQEGDPDQEAARDLNIEHSLASAFCRPDQDAIAQADLFAVVAEFAILTDVPVGETNAEVVRQALEYSATGKPFIIVGNRQKTGGKIRGELEEKLLEYNNVTLANDITDTLRKVNRIAEGLASLQDFQTD